MGVTIFLGLHPHLRPAAAQLYWEAFGGKLGRVLGPDRRALVFFERVIRADHCFTALDETGALLGLGGFKTPAASFAGGSWADLRAVYGPFGGRWRGMILRRLAEDVESDRLQVDGLCVAPDHRGKGIGSLLLSALCREAVDRGYRSIGLDVTADNLRARALYARHGFLPVRTEELGLARHVFGFAASTTMVRRLDTESE